MNVIAPDIRYSLISSSVITFVSIVIPIVSIIDISIINNFSYFTASFCIPINFIKAKYPKSFNNINAKIIYHLLINTNTAGIYAKNEVLNKYNNILKNIYFIFKLIIFPPIKEIINKYNNEIKYADKIKRAKENADAVPSLNTIIPVIIKIKVKIYIFFFKLNSDLYCATLNILNGNTNNIKHTIGYKLKYTLTADSKIPGPSIADKNKYPSEKILKKKNSIRNTIENPAHFNKEEFKNNFLFSSII